MRKINFQEFKNNLTTEQIIDLVEELGGLYSESKSTSEYLIFSSFLYHVGDAELHSFKMYYYIDSSNFFDYKLGEGFDIYELIIRKFELYDDKQMNVLSAYGWICNTLGIDSSISIETESKYNYLSDIGKYINKETTEKTLKYYDESILNRFPRLYHTNWLEDNITIEAMEKFNIRYYPAENEIVIPCYDINNKLIGIRVRNVDPNKDWKYMPLSLLDGTTFKFPTAKVLYGLNHNAENIKKSHKAIIMESEKAVLQCEGYVKEGQNITLGLFGSAFTKDKLQQLLDLNVNEIIIGYDFDYETIGDNDAWHKFEDKVYKTADMIKPFCNVSAMVDYNKHKLKSSPTDMGKNKFFRLFTDREEL